MYAVVYHLPFVDHFWNIPWNQKIRLGQNKCILFTTSTSFSWYAYLQTNVAYWKICQKLHIWCCTACFNHVDFFITVRINIFSEKKVLLRTVTHYKLIVLKITLLTVHKQNRKIKILLKKSQPHVKWKLNTSPPYKQFSNFPQLKQHRFHRSSTVAVAYCTTHISYLPDYKMRNFFPSSASEESVGHFTITHMLHDMYDHLIFG